MKKSYYYFVSSLKDISLDMEKTPYELGDFIEELFNVVSEEDRKLLDAFLLQFDNFNLINKLEKRKANSKLSLMSDEELSEAIKRPEDLKGYMGKFLEVLKEGERTYPDLSTENELLVYYYEYLLSVDNDFMSSYYSFDALLRNIISGLNSRKYGYNIEKTVLPIEEDEYLKIVKSSASDFGLSSTHPWVGELVSVFQSEDHINILKKSDQLRFDKIDELLFFDWFSIDSILGYLIKLSLLDAWLKLNDAEGKKAFDSSVELLLGQEDFLDQFKKVI